MIKKTLLVIFIAISAAAGYAQTGGGNNGKGSTMRTEVLVDTKDQPVSTYEFTYDANTNTNARGTLTSSITLKYDGNGNLTVEEIRGADGQVITVNGQSGPATTGKTAGGAAQTSVECDSKKNNQGVKQ